MGNENGEQRMGTGDGSKKCEWKYCFGWKSFYTLQNSFLNTLAWFHACLDLLTSRISPFASWFTDIRLFRLFTKSVKREINHCNEIPNTFFVLISNNGIWRLRSAMEISFYQKAHLHNLAISFRESLFLLFLEEVIFNYVNCWYVSN